MQSKTILPLALLARVLSASPIPPSTENGLDIQTRVATPEVSYPEDINNDIEHRFHGRRMFQAIAKQVGKEVIKSPDLIGQVGEQIYDGVNQEPPKPFQGHMLKEQMDAEKKKMENQKASDSSKVPIPDPSPFGPIFAGKLPDKLDDKGGK
ncbi:hypothetical protein OIDMADRAFT_30887 [Oidiodendron maius Zn]|uniref:Uncharacterized protein n=1 Tax=Oidiodendron maius (strain Zn) TaxID=913774 RepID=A0A0C3HA84_OIDMZ|nr:hypothetical protein OIDMADRAFT_30887 [Oidiodendron maius Zn]